MLVIHPNDKSTELAKVIYADLNADVVEPHQYARGIGTLLCQNPASNPILMIGYGDCDGMYLQRFSNEVLIDPLMLSSSMPDSAVKLYFERIANCMSKPTYIVRNLHAYSLRKQHGNLIGIWPGAAEFAARNKLHGLFTNEFIYNHKDAAECGLITLDMYLDEANLILYQTLGSLIAKGLSLREIAAELKKCASSGMKHISRNFDSFVYL